MSELFVLFKRRNVAGSAVVEEEKNLMIEGGRETEERLNRRKKTQGTATLLWVHAFCTAARLHRPIYSCHLPYAVSCLSPLTASSPDIFTI